MHTAILRLGILLTSVALGTSAATAQTEFSFAAGVDSTGWAQAQSNADGRVLIESPQYPRGMWLHLADEAGQVLVGLRVEYQGRADSLVAIRCIDLFGRAQETLVWIRPDGDLLRLTLKPREVADLPAGIAFIDWRIDPSAEPLLVPKEETRLIGWEKVSAFLQARWQSQTERVAVQLDANTVAIDVDHQEAIETLAAYLRRTQPGDAALGAISPWEVQIYSGSLDLWEGVTLFKISLFDDSDLERAVRQALRRVEDVSSLYSVSAVGRGIQSLAGLEYFPALRSLNLFANEIVDLTPLSELTNLTHVTIDANRIADLSPLDKLVNLKELDLDHNEVVGLTGLNQLTNLTSLHLYENRVVDLSPLNQLTNLEVLNLAKNRIVDLTPLNQLTNLTHLYLRGNDIIDLSPLNQLTKLTDLYLGGNEIVDLSPLNQLTNLYMVSLEDNEIVDLTPLAALTSLNWLHLGRNAIIDLSPLNQLNLDILTLNGNEIVDLSPLNQLTNLRKLAVGSNEIVDVSPLNHLTNLTDLYLAANEIVDLSPLSTLTRLHWLGLENNRIEDLAPLVANSGLGEGDRLYLSGNPLSDQALNEQIPALQARGVSVAY